MRTALRYRRLSALLDQPNPAGYVHRDLSCEGEEVLPDLPPSPGGALHFGEPSTNPYIIDAREGFDSCGLLSHARNRRTQRTGLAEDKVTEHLIKGVRLSAAAPR